MTWTPTGRYDQSLAEAEKRAEARRNIRNDREQAEQDALIAAGYLEDGLALFATHLEALGVASRHDTEVTGVHAGIRRLIRRIDPDYDRSQYAPDPETVRVFRAKK